MLIAGLLLLSAAFGQIPIDGGCTVGASQQAHAVSAADAEARIRGYARRYIESYSGYKRHERDIRRKAYSYMELKGWSQDDVIGFTREQRELLYIAIGGELAQGKIDSSAVPGYVNAIERKMAELEVELGCILPSQP
jgi:hypothetical protein